MSTRVYRRILNEYTEFEYKPNYNVSYFQYRINPSIRYMYFISEIFYIYKKQKYNITIIYSKYYPIKCPRYIKINNVNIYDIYSNIITRNPLIFSDNHFKNKSILYNQNWNENKRLRHILKEVCRTIDYNKLYIKIKLLNQICSKYTNEDMSFMHYYLL